MARLARLGRLAARDPVRARVAVHTDLDAFIGGVGPMRDGATNSTVDPKGRQ
jgi:hypothetical protein